jgi:hypothetical protein
MLAMAAWEAGFTPQFFLILPINSKTKTASHLRSMHFFLWA